MASNSTFHQANGFLRLFGMVMNVAAIGLTASKFRQDEFYDFIFLAALVFTTSVSFIHFFLTFLAACVRGRGKCFKITDFIFHFIGGILLLVSSVYMLMGAPKRGKQLDYRFQDTSQVLVRTTAGILGMQNSGIYFILAYLTMADRRLVYCTSNNSKEGSNGPADDEMAGDPGQEDQLEEGTNSNKSVFFDRFTWRRLLVDEILEARILTLLLGILNGVLIADSYQKGYDFEEYFFSMVVICFCLTFLSQSSYAFRIVRLNETVASVIDVLLQLFSSLSLLAGGILMLGSVIQNNSYGYQYKSIERTSAALVGILNGLVYCHIGMTVKRAHFQQKLNDDVNYIVNSASNNLVLGKRPTRRPTNNTNNNNGRTVTTARVESSVTNEDSKQGCAVS